MNITEAVFLIGFMGALLITAAKLYNLFSLGEFYDTRKAWLLFIGYLMAHAMVFFIAIIEYSNVLYRVLSQVLYIVLVLQIVFIVAEQFFLVRDSIRGVERRYNPSGRR